MNNSAERRIKPRIFCEYPAIVEGYNGQGKKFNENAILANLSASGLFMKSPRIVKNGAHLSVTILMSSDVVCKDTPKIATNGVVVRTEPDIDGTCGVAIKFNSYQFR
jgi:hypothetical protein